MPELLELHAIEHVADPDTLHNNGQAFSPATRRELVEAFRAMDLGSALALTAPVEHYADAVYQAIDRTLYLFNEGYYRLAIQLHEPVRAGIARAARA